MPVKAGFLFRNIMKFLIIILLACPLIANPEDLSKRGFTLIDATCVLVEKESPILLSEIKKLAKTMSFKEAQSELITKKLLWVLAKKRKIDVSNIESASTAHLSKVMKDNNKSKEQFEQILLDPPYEMSLKQFKQATADAILENQLKSNIASQLLVSDTELKTYLKKKEQDLKNSFDIVFISVHKSATRQSEKALAISKEITVKTSFDTIKGKYKTDEDNKELSIIGPISGELNPLYDKKLVFKDGSVVTAPFKDGTDITIIWKIKNGQKLDENALVKEFYEARVNQNLKAELKAVEQTSSINILCK
jgi:16S rRNA G966 N2-methylase RsmD